MYLLLSNDKELQKLINRYKKKFPDSNWLYHLQMLNGGNYMGMNYTVEEAKEVLKKCLKENMIFQVWSYKWKKKDELMPCDWWEGKLVYMNKKQNK